MFITVDTNSYFSEGLRRGLPCFADHGRLQEFCESRKNISCFNLPRCSPPLTPLTQQIRQQEKHNSELASLEAHLRNAETLCKIARREHEALRDSRERVAEAVATVGRRRGGMAAAAEERDGSALQLCFWGWARVAQRGEAAVVKKKERIDAQRALSGVRVMLAAAVDRAREAETERDRQR